MADPTYVEAWIGDEKAFEMYVHHDEFEMAVDGEWVIGGPPDCPGCGAETMLVDDGYLCEDCEEVIAQ